MNTPNAPKVDYDEAAANYDASRSAGTKTAALLRQLLAPLTGATVLDVGCGTANFLAEVAGFAGRAVGLDLSAGMLSQAASKQTGAHLVRGNAGSLPFDAQTFDAVYCIQVLHHLPEKQRFMAEVHRVLKAGGRFVIQSCSHAQLKTFWDYHYFPRALEIDLRRMPDVADIRSMLTTAGFHDISVRSCPFEWVFRVSPASYLEKSYRDGDSTYSLLTPQEIEEGCARIRADIRAGRTEEVTASYDRQAEKIPRVLNCLKFFL